MTWKLAGVLGLAFLATACGTDPQERTTGGAAAGAATGAGVGALGGPAGALAGAAIGAGAGAVAGATTDPSDVNLGKPPWTNPQARVPGVETGAERRAAPRMNEEVRQAQMELDRSGFDPGPADGIWGPQTRSAVMEFQRANNMDATGRLDGRTLQALRGGGGGMGGSAPASQTGASQPGTPATPPR
jgi:hypothetical protein